MVFVLSLAIQENVTNVINTTFTQDTSKWVPVVPESPVLQSWVVAFHNNDSAMQSLSKVWASMHFLSGDLAFFRANDDITRLNFPVQNILKLDYIIRVVLEETPGVHQVKE